MEIFKLIIAIQEISDEVIQEIEKNGSYAPREVIQRAIENSVIKRVKFYRQDYNFNVELSEEQMKQVEEYAANKLLESFIHELKILENRPYVFQRLTGLIHPGSETLRLSIAAFDISGKKHPLKK